MGTLYDPYLSKLNDRIIDSKTVHIPGLILPGDVQNFQTQIGSILSFSLALSQLPLIPDMTLNMLDFDDTLHSRYRQLQANDFQDNRGDKGMEVVREWGYQDVLERFYSHSEIVKRLFAIIEKQGPKHKAVILTAGEADWQISKCRSIGIQEGSVPIEVVQKSDQKPRRLLEYIIALGYIPGKIIIYEDRPEPFLRVIRGFTQILQGTEVVIDKVVLTHGNSRQQIDHIDQTIFVCS